VSPVRVTVFTSNEPFSISAVNDASSAEGHSSLTLLFAEVEELVTVIEASGTITTLAVLIQEVSVLLLFNVHLALINPSLLPV
jgi:hypothetical protein